MLAIKRWFLRKFNKFTHTGMVRVGGMFGQRIELHDKGDYWIDRRGRRFNKSDGYMLTDQRYDHTVLALRSIKVKQ